MKENEKQNASKDNQTDNKDIKSYVTAKKNEEINDTKKASRHEKHGITDDSQKSPEETAEEELEPGEIIDEQDGRYLKESN